MLFLTALDTPEELVGAVPGIRADNIIKKPVEHDRFVALVKERLHTSKRQMSVENRGHSTVDFK